MPSHLRRWMEVHAKRGSGAEKLPSTINTCWHNFIFFLLHVSRIFPFLWLRFASVSLCHCSSPSFIYQPAVGDNGKRHEEAIKTAISFYFWKKEEKKKTQRLQQLTCACAPTSTCSQSPAPPSPPAPPYPHVQHSQPAVKLIASTSFQGHTITASYSQPCYMNT